MNKDKIKKGYTFLEIVLVMVITGVMSYTVMLSHITLEIKSLERGSDKIQNTIRQLQQEAIITGKPKGIRFSNDKIELLSEENYRILKIDEIKFSKIKMKSTTIKETELWYTKRGTVRNPGQIILESENFTQKITINIGSGRVKKYKIEEK